MYKRQYGVLTLTFEMRTSYLNASWWMVDSCMARIGEQGMLFCAVNSQLRIGAGKGNPWWMVDSCMAGIGEQGLLLCAVNSQLRTGAGKGNPWWMVDSCTARIGEQGMIL